MKLIRTLKEKAKILKQEIVVLFLAFQHTKTPTFAKLLIAITIGYAVSPIDLIPDFIPVIGLIDDLILLPAMIVIAIRLIPEEIITECRKLAQEKNEINKSFKIVAAVSILLIWGYLLWLIVQYSINNSV